MYAQTSWNIKKNIGHSTHGARVKQLFLKTHIDPVAVASVEWVAILTVKVGKEFLNIPEASYLELLWLFDDDLKTASARCKLGHRF